MVVVLGKLDAVEKSGGALEPTAPTVFPDVAMRPQGETDSGASEPAGSTGSRHAVELTEGAKRAAQSLADMLEDQPKSPIRRKARNGYFYTKDEFLEHYDEYGHCRWDEAGE